MGPGGGTGRQLVSIQAAGFQIEEPGGARDLPQFNTHSEHKRALSDVITRVRQAAASLVGDGSSATAGLFVLTPQAAELSDREVV